MSGQHRREHACRILQNGLTCEKSCKFISSLQCESSPSRIFPQAHPGKHFANLRYMARHFLPTARITGVLWRSSDRFTNHLQYTSAETRSSHRAGRRRSKLCIAALPDPAQRRRYCPSQMWVRPGSRMRSGLICCAQPDSPPCSAIYIVGSAHSGCRMTGIGVFLASIRFQT